MANGGGRQKCNGERAVNQCELGQLPWQQHPSLGAVNNVGLDPLPASFEGQGGASMHAAWDELEQSQ